MMRTGFAKNCLLTLILLASSVGAKADNRDVDNEALCREVWGHVQQDYYQPVDEKAFFAACPDSLDTLLNKHSGLVVQSPSNGRDYFGAIGLEMKLDGEWPKVLVVYEGFPAAEAQLQKNDLIVAIDGVSTQGQTLDEVAKRLRGEVGSKVTLTLKRGDQAFSPPPIPRRVIRIPTVSTQEIQPGILWVRVSRFEQNTVRDVVDALMERQRVKDKAPIKGLVFDFRQNPGGRLGVALALAAAFLPEEMPLVRIQDRSGKERTIGASDSELIDRTQILRLPPELKSLPLVVLMNKNSAAGPEITAGALQHYGKAKVVGTPSFGKNTIEAAWVVKSQPDTYLKLTSSIWTYPDGRSVKGGLVPDVLAEGENDTVETVEATDATAALALKVLEERTRFLGEEVPLMLAQAKKHYQARDRKAALVAFDDILAQAPYTPSALYYRAVTLAELGQVDAARQAREQFVRWAGDKDRKNINPVNCWTGVFTGDYSLATEACEREIRADPKEAPPWINLGHVALLKGDEKAAWRYYQTAMPMMGTYWPISVEDAQEDFKLLAQQKFLPKKLSPKQVLVIQAKFEKQYQALASSMGQVETLSLQYMRGNVDGSLTAEEKQSLLEKILAEEERLLSKHHPRTLETLTRLGMVHLKKDRFEQAKGYFQKALDGYRSLPQPQSKSALMERAIKVCEKGMEKAEKANNPERTKLGEQQ